MVKCWGGKYSDKILVFLSMFFLLSTSKGSYFSSFSLMILIVSVGTAIVSTSCIAIVASLLLTEGNGFQAGGCTGK